MSSGKKSLKRLERQKAKREKAAAKNIKQFAKPLITKLVKQANDPNTKKQAKSVELGSRYHLRMSWSVDLEDRKGRWSWGVNRDWGDKLSNSLIYPFLVGCERDTWGRLESLKAGGNHRHMSYDVSQIRKEARDRLVELELDDQENIFRFRMTGAERLYGFIMGTSVFYTVWFDPTHDIYPTSKK